MSQINILLIFQKREFNFGLGWESPHEGTAIKVFSLWPLGSDEMISSESITAFGADVQYKWPILPVTEQYFLESTQYFK